MSATARRWPAQPPSVPGLPPRPVVMWAPYRYGVFSWLQSQDQQIAETVAFLRGEILRGVTDGSEAVAGQLGEFRPYLVTVPFTPPTLNTTVNAGVLPPGDWDLTAWCDQTVFMDNIQFELEPVPAGFVGGLNAYRGTTAPGAEAETIHAGMARALTPAPSPLTFRVILNGATAGDFTLTVFARRMR